VVDKYYKTTVQFQFVSGLPKDVSVNNWAFKHAGATDVVADANSIHDRLETFYEGFASLYSSRVDPLFTTFKTYDLADPEPRVPVLEEVKGLSGFTGANMDLPGEVAMCLSFKGTSVSGANARRRRGRVYLGPLQTSTTTDYYAVLASMITSVMNSADTALAPNTDSIIWCVYSKYTHYGVPVGDVFDPDIHDPDDGLLPNALVPVSSFWMDNEWDTQRRRGLTPTSRSSMTV